MSTSDLKAEIDRFSSADALGRSAPLKSLFDYLAAKALAGEAVGEIDIAVDVFGKTGADPGDASVRVYIHRLRKKLDEHYASPKVTGDMRLDIPRGEYRLALVERELVTAPGGQRARKYPWAFTVAALAVGVLGVLMGLLVAPGREDVTRVLTLRDSPIWADMAADPRPVTIVVGDYFIFGDGADGFVTRLVREFDVNSPLDLESHIIENPDRAGEYVNLDLYYTPVSATVAMGEISPVAHAVAGEGQVSVVMASDLTPELLRNNHIIYVGLISGLGALENTVFTASSRFGVGNGYDEILDYETREVYASEAGQAADDMIHLDYGYVSSFIMANGNRILVIAGTRDVGVLQTAEALTDPSSIRALSQSVDGSDSLEGVYEVEALGQANLMGRLILSAPRPDFNQNVAD